MKLFAALALVASFAIAAAQAQEIKRDFAKSEELIIKSIQGETRVSASIDDQVHIKLNKVSFSEKCALKFEQTAGVIEIKVEKTGWFSSLNGKDCQLNIEAQVPPLKIITIGQTSGLIEIKSISAANVDVNAISATVNVDADVARVAAKTVSGAISIHAPAAKDVFMKSVSGGLELDAESSKPAIELVTVSGSATMRAAQAPQITFKSVSGRLISKAMTGTGDGAPVNFKSVSGSLTIQ